MKKLLFPLLAVCLLIVSSCQDDDKDDSPKLSLEKSSIELSCEAQSKNIQIHASHTGFSVKVVEGSDWLSISETGDNYIIVSVTRNTDDFQRIGTLLVTATADNKITKQITVKQNPAEIIETKGKSADMLIALVCPEEDLNCADFVLTYVYENGESVEQTITKSDFKEAQTSSLPVFLDGNTQVGLNDGDRYWLYRKHFETTDVHYSVFVEYAVKSSNVFSSKAALSVQTNNGEEQIDLFKSPLMMLNSTYINITSDESYKKYFWFGYEVDIDNDWKISASKLGEDDIPLFSKTQSNYLSETVEKLIDQSYNQIDEILAALPNDSENEEEVKTFVYAASLPSDVFGEDIALEWELKPYQNIISYKCKYKLEQSSSWMASGSAIGVDEAREKLKNSDFRRKIIRMYEKQIHNILIQ